MAHIIGLDLGNCFSFPCYIPELDPTVSRLGGRPVDLLPSNMHYGFPSLFFYSDKAADRAREGGYPMPPWCGDQATKSTATPEKNRVRNLKRHLGEPLKLDSWEGGYDDAVVELIQYLVRRANEALKKDALETSNLLSLAYPATFTRSKCSHLKNLAEKATLEDGTRVKVVGMIAEPAAAALDYLVEGGRSEGETTVLTYDLGGGTFDLAVVTAYPEGKSNNVGQTYYYDIESTGGLESLGGTEFDKVMLGLLQSKVPESETVAPISLRRLAQTAKEELTDDERWEGTVFSISGEAIDLIVTREEFEVAAMPLVQKTVGETRRMLDEALGKSPELIVLTGGASQMPIIKREIEKAFPEFADKVVSYRPARAIAYGSARYGTPVEDADVQQRVPRDLGIVHLIRGTEDKYARKFISAGTPLPFNSGWMSCQTRSDNQSESSFSVTEAKVLDPDDRELDRDYSEIMSVSLHHDPPVPAGYPMEARLVLDRDGLLTVEARDPGKPGKPAVSNSCVLSI